MQVEYKLELLSLFPTFLVHAGEQRSELHACNVNIDLSCFHYFPTLWCMKVSNNRTHTNKKHTKHIKPPTIRFVFVEMNINLNHLELLLSLCAYVQTSV